MRLYSCWNLLESSALAFGTQQLTTGRFLTIDTCDGFILAHATHDTGLLDLDEQLVAGHDLARELGLVQLDQVIDTAKILFRGQGYISQDATGLRHGFENLHTWHVGLAGELTDRVITRAVDWLDAHADAPEKVPDCPLHGTQLCS